MPKRTLIIVGLLAAVILIYVYRGNAPANTSSTTAPTDDQCRVSVTVDVLNVRSAPDEKAGVVGKYEQGAEANVDKKVTNGFRRIGDDRWVAAEFVKPVDGSICD